MLNALNQDDSDSYNYFSLTPNSSQLFKVSFQTGRSLGQELAAILGTNFHQQVVKLVLLLHRACFIQFSHLLCWFLYKVAVINKLLCSTPKNSCISAQDEKKMFFRVYWNQIITRSKLLLFLLWETIFHFECLFLPSGDMSIKVTVPASSTRLRAVEKMEQNRGFQILCWSLAAKGACRAQFKG